ncbi:MAG: hypothetical protein ACYC6I_09900 [Bacillota bacterium]
MSVFRGDPSRRPSLAVTSLYALGSIILIGLLATIPALVAGVPASDALGGVFLAPRFWVATGLPVAAFAALFTLTYPFLWRHLVVGRGRFPTGGWKRNVYLSSASGLFFLFVVARGVWNRVAGGMTVLKALSDLILVVIMAVATVLMLVYAWLAPSEEKARAIETGDYSRLRDERHRLLAMRSAHAVLSVALIVILTVGSAVDIFTYHGYPVRSFIEAGVLLAAWQAAYAYWDRRL